MSKQLLVVVGIALVSLVIFWMPFLFRFNTFWGINFAKQGMNVIVQNFDGLNYLVIAKSLYDPRAIEAINTQFLTGNDPGYFAAHFPLYPLIIKVLAIFMSPTTALILSIVLSNILLTVGLYWFFSTLAKNQRLALILAVVALFFPARMLSVRAVASTEPLFIFFILGSLTLALKNRHGYAAIMGSLAVLTRSPGILLFAGYMLSALASYRTDIPRMIRERWIYGLMPVTLLGLFGFYALQYGDFWAYFNSGDNLHLFFPPFQIFSNMQSWISEIWREDIIYQYLFYGLGLALLSKSKIGTRDWGELAALAFTVIYGSVLLLVSHRDLARYALPIAPLILAGYRQVAEKIKIIEWKWASILLIPIFLLGWQFVLGNMQPINDWSVFASFSR